MSASVPVIDLKGQSPLLVSDEIARACRDIGFLAFVNHPLQSKIPHLFDISGEFFRGESSEAKRACSISIDNKGYSHLGQEKLDPNDPLTADHKEAFNFGLILDPDHPSQPLPPLLQKKVVEIAQFQRDCHEFCLQLLRALARGLNLPDENFFSSKHGFEPDNGSILRFLRYPATDTNPIRASQHSDYGSLTLLFQQFLPGSNGLQILPPSEPINGGKWLDVGVVKDSVIVNIGDQIEFWTGRHYKSTLHRVVVPENPLISNGTQNNNGDDQSSTPDRYSIVFFNHPVGSTKLEPVIPSKEISANDIERLEHKGVKVGTAPTAHEHLLMRLKATYRYD